MAGVDSIWDAFEELLRRQELPAAQRDAAAQQVQEWTDFCRSHFAMAGAPSPIGSYARGTLCAGEREIDLLIPLAAADYWGDYAGDSQAFLSWVRDVVHRRRGPVRLSARRLAVKIATPLITVNLVPCFPRDGNGYLMPDGAGGWKSTNPLFHIELIERSDVMHSRRVKPLIKLIKAWNLANGRPLSSLHLELVTVDMKHHLPTSLPWVIEVGGVLQTIAERLRSTFPDPWPEGTRIDAYLSAEHRERAVQLLERHHGAIGQAARHLTAWRIEAAFEQWQLVYNGSFPACEPGAGLSAMPEPVGGPFSVPFGSDGGPLMVLPSGLLNYWEGIDPPSDGRVIATDADGYLDEFAGTDYARACAAEGLVDVIPVGHGTGLVLGAGEQVGLVHWLRLPDLPGVMLVITVECDDYVDPAIIPALRGVPDERWQLVHPAWEVGSDSLTLMHGADNGRDVAVDDADRLAGISQAISWRLPTGTYAIEQHRLELANGSKFVVIRLRPT
jgi:hypothetical protein